MEMAFTPLHNLIGAILLTITLVGIAVISILFLVAKVYPDDEYGDDTSDYEDISDDE